MKVNGIYKLAILVYVLSLVLPMDGKWFSGLGYFIVSGFYSLIFIIDFDISQIEISPKIFNLGYLFYPFTNIIFFISAYRYRNFESMHALLFYFLMLSTLVAILLSVQIAYHHKWEMYFSFFWSASFVILIFAIIKKIKSARKYEKYE